VQLTTGRKDLIWGAAQRTPATSTFCYKKP
jgi:hypothetical protein